MRKLRITIAIEIASKSKSVARKVKRYKDVEAAKLPLDSVLLSVLLLGGIGD